MSQMPTKQGPHQTHRRMFRHATRGSKHQNSKLRWTKSKGIAQIPKLKSQSTRRGEENTDGTLLGKKGEFTQGQKEEGINCPPEARQLYFKIPSTPTTTSIGPENKMGFTKGVTETKTRGYSANSPQPQQEKGSDWKVYSRGKGCRKKWTPTNSQQISSNPDSKDLDPQSTTRCLKQSTSTSNNNLLHEVINQWEMAKDLGMTCDGEEPNIIGKIKSMELRDREEAALLGNKNTPP